MDNENRPRQGHDPEEIRKHDDIGRDRLFEDREQHDEAEKNSEKTRLARDVDRHNHDVDDDVADSGSGPSAKRKSDAPQPERKQPALGENVSPRAGRIRRASMPV